MTVLKHEMKRNAKSLLIWTLCVGLSCFGCILLYTSMEASMKGMADSFSDMGVMSRALGMDKLSLAALSGYYATEIAMMHNLLGAMFAAILGTGLLSKEEAGHTSEFLYTFPVSRRSIVFQKYQALLYNILLFNLFCTAMYLFGFVMLGEEIDGKVMALYHSASFFMQVEVGTICFLISAFAKRNLIGAGLGAAVLFFASDMMCRVVPAIEKLKYVTPFYFANASDIFINGEINGIMLLTAAVATLCCLAAAVMAYDRKDLAQ